MVKIRPAGPHSSDGHGAGSDPGDAGHAIKRQKSDASQGSAPPGRAPPAAQRPPEEADAPGSAAGGAPAEAGGGLQGLLSGYTSSEEED